MYTWHPMIYLDWAATAPPLWQVRAEAFQKAEELYANPSSVHGAGRAARDCIERARRSCADSLGAHPRDIYFTSGATESNNIVFSSFFNRPARGSVVITGIEHPSVYEPAKALEKAGFAVRYIQADSDGVVDPERFAAGVDGDTVLAAVMLVNNETGAVQPVAEITRLIRQKSPRASRRVHIHTDAVQAFGKQRISCDEMGVDSLAASGHKIGAPRGGGILFLNRPLDTLYRGGEQESAVRPGTENLEAIYGLGKAVEIWEEHREEWNEHARELKRLLLERISAIDGACLVGPAGGPAQRHSPFIITVSFPPAPGEVIVRVMSDRGFAVSTGSACSSRGKKNLRVLQNMGIDRGIAGSAIRISTGPATAVSDCDAFCTALERETAALRGRLR